MVGFGLVRRGRSRALAAIVATALATLAPPLAGVALGAPTSLKDVATATYTLDPEHGAVHVVVDETYTNRKPNSGGFFYFYDKVGLTIHAEASAIKASDSNGSLAIKTKKIAAREDSSGSFFAGTSVVVTLRHNLRYKQSTKVRIAFDLVGDARSPSRVRAGQGFATFPVWAWGDDNSSKVTVRLPPGFVATSLQNSMTAKTADDGSTTLTASPVVSQEFWAQIQAVRRDGLQDLVLPIGDGSDVHLQSLVDDPAWAAAVGPNLLAGLPVLRELIGLPLPTTDPIELHEGYVPTLDHVVYLPLARDQGYGVGAYRSPTEIVIGESLDEHAALSAASTIWFNDALISGRWIDSGMADEYSALALKSLGRSTPPPTKPNADDPGAQPLDLWTRPYLSKVKLKDEPAFIKLTEQKEAYGASASWFVVHALVTEVGVEGMRNVLAACANDEIAYLGAGAPENVAPVDGWQRLLDLLEERAGATTAEQLFSDYVLASAARASLAPRSEARAAYSGLVASGNGWLPPILVRGAMGEWDFPAAMSAIADAQSILALRAQVEQASTDLGLTPSPALKAAYETASDSFDAARTEAEAELAALAAIAHARTTLDAPVDFVSTIGLLGTTPETRYDAAKTAFNSGDLAGAVAGAGNAEAVVIGAPEVGRQRLVIAGAVTGLLVLLLIALFLVRRRRSRRAGMVADIAPPPDSR